MPSVRPSRLRAQIARQILEVIRREDLRPGYHLTEQALAQRFGISRTPVRAALRILSSSGLLAFRPNQGYFLAQAAKQIAGASELPASADEALYMRLARDRVAAKLPDTFTETELMRRYQAGRGLVLTVLARMSEEGLVRRGKGREWIFLPFLSSEEAHGDSYDFRLILEPAALLLPSFKVDRDRLVLSRDRHLELISSPRPAHPSSELFQLDADFHEMLAALAGNSFVLAAVQHQNGLRRLIEYAGYSDGARLKEWCQEHVDVIDAILDDNMPRAASLLHSHLTNARRQVTKTLTNSGPTAGATRKS